MANSIVRLDKVASKHVNSVKHTADLQNGQVVFLGGLSAGEFEIHDVEVASASNIANKPLHLHATPEVMPFGYEGLKDFSVKSGRPARAIQLEVGDIYTVTTDGLTGAFVVGNYVAPVAGDLKLKADPALPTTRFVGRIIEVTTLGFDATQAVAILVEKN